MGYSLESTIWKEAQATFHGEAFTDIVELAVSSYRRRPDYSRIERIYASDVCEGGLQVLRYALRHVDHLPSGELPEYVSVRAALRAHIYSFLESQVIRAGDSFEVIAEDQLSRDLGFMMLRLTVGADAGRRQHISIRGLSMASVTKS